jgi:tryptophan-rich hypothetical protein
LNKLNPKKLLHSKWTAVLPKNKEKHFIVSEADYDEDSLVVSCFLEALMSKRQVYINWRDLKDDSIWVQGWD